MMRRRSLETAVIIVLLIIVHSVGYASPLSSMLPEFPSLSLFGEEKYTSFANVSEGQKYDAIKDCVLCELEDYAAVSLHKLEVTLDATFANGPRYTVTLNLVWNASDTLPKIRERADCLCDAIAGRLAEDEQLTTLVCKWNAPQTLCASVAGKKQYSLENHEVYIQSTSGAMYS